MLQELFSDTPGSDIFVATSLAAAAKNEGAMRSQLNERMIWNTIVKLKVGDRVSPPISIAVIAVNDQILIECIIGKDLFHIPTPCLNEPHLEGREGKFRTQGMPQTIDVSFECVLSVTITCHDQGICPVKDRIGKAFGYLHAVLDRIPQLGCIVADHPANDHFRSIRFIIVRICVWIVGELDPIVMPDKMPENGGPGPNDLRFPDQQQVAIVPEVTC